MQLMITVNDFVYTTGQGGTPLYTNDFTMVNQAAVIGISQVADAEPLISDVKGVGLGAGSIVTDSGTLAPVGNEILLILYNVSGGTLVEAASGTIASITLLVDGN